VPTGKKTLRTCNYGHRYYKSSDCLTCPICEAGRKPENNFIHLLAAPARRALENNGIVSLEQLMHFGERELLELHGMGKATIVILRKALNENGLTFKNIEQ
jgi:hypothetical protein